MGLPVERRRNSKTAIRTPSRLYIAMVNVTLISEITQIRVALLVLGGSNHSNPFSTGICKPSEDHENQGHGRNRGYNGRPQSDAHGS